MLFKLTVALFALALASQGLVILLLVVKALF